MHFNRKTIIELQDSTLGVPLVLGYSVRICPGGHLTVPLECTRPVTDRMDIRMDIGFHHRNPNVYVVPTRMEEAPKAALDIHCLQQGGRVALTQMINLIPPPRGDGGARA